MTIRDATRADLEAITEIYNREVELSTSTFDTRPRSTEQATEWFEAHGLPGYPVIVAEDGGNVLGWASLSPWSDRGAYARTAEGSLFVSEGWRGAGIGRRLTEALIARARAAGHGVLIARIESGNEASRRLLLGAGFRSVGTMRRVGQKFGRVLDVEMFELQLD
jgi:phosphinothricin acetyltransferase